MQPGTQGPVVPASGSSECPRSHVGEAQAGAHLGGDDPVVRVPLRDVGLGAWRGFPVAHIDRPAVHPVLLPGTLRAGNRAVGVGGARGARSSRGWL